MTVWDTLVGQRAAVTELAEAAAGRGMTHAWLVTGPPGSGRSNAALAFAAALQCAEGGCGDCPDCTQVLAGSHPDVTVKRTEKVVISVDEARAWVRDASLQPVRGSWQVIVVEDADRLHERANNALLKAIEEPGSRTVWVLCAPHAEDVLPTIRSRARRVTLATPRAEEVARFLQDRVGVDAALAAHAARASQGHIGLARALATQEETRNRRREVVTLPGRLTSLGAAMTAAANVVELATQEAAARTSALADREMADVTALYGEDRKARSTRSYRAAEAEVRRTQKARERRLVLDSVDRALTDLLSVLRDLLVLQTGAGQTLVNEELRPGLQDLARQESPEQTLRKIAAVGEAREQMMEFNVPPLLAMEALMVSLRLRPQVAR